MGRSFLVLGKAATWLGSGYDDWKKTIGSSLPDLSESEFAGAMLDFRVNDFKRNGQRFDVDNLASVVFQAAFGSRGSRAQLAYLVAGDD